jgi:hypothetical protein
MLQYVFKYLLSFTRFLPVTEINIYIYFLCAEMFLSMNESLIQSQLQSSLSGVHQIKCFPLLSELKSSEGVTTYRIWVGKLIYWTLKHIIRDYILQITITHTD